jgi:hypothetical protein
MKKLGFSPQILVKKLNNHLFKRLFRHCGVKNYKGEEVQLHAFLASALNANKCSYLHFSRFTPKKKGGGPSVPLDVRANGRAETSRIELQHPALDEVEGFTNRQLTEMPITFRLSINRQHPTSFKTVRTLCL